jgi:demethylmenaquinone methyltransferase/2-methoxy-6-polyprenyl-1,4-benzoquinol methylase
MFGTVAPTYDLTNKVLTFGLDQQWRRTCTHQALSGEYIIDLCCGTGDLSLQLMPHLATGSFLVGLDFSKEMLSRAVKKKKKQFPDGEKWKADFAFIIADAAHIPLRDGIFGDVRISFSFRNLIYKNPQAINYLKEVNRILKSNGRFSCVETSQPKNSLVRAFFHFYCLKAVPFAGKIICGKNGPYAYLGKSAANFPFPQEIMAMLKRAGFRITTYRPLSLGIVALYQGKK